MFGVSSNCHAADAGHHFCSLINSEAGLLYDAHLKAVFNNHNYNP